jgi:hypothetical protein
MGVQPVHEDPGEVLDRQRQPRGTKGIWHLGSRLVGPAVGHPNAIPLDHTQEIPHTPAKVRQGAPIPLLRIKRTESGPALP